MKSQAIQIAGQFLADSQGLYGLDKEPQVQKFDGYEKAM